MAVGYIYILTNPSFPQYVKIGYADNVENRLAQLNRSECIPFAFRVYATYEVQSRLSDMKVHAIIDKLNPNLRSIEDFKGQKRVREFYAMTPEDAYSILEAIAEINGQKDKLKKIAMTSAEKAAAKTAEEVETEHRERLSPFTFSKCGIQPGEYVEWYADPTMTFKVIDDKNVEYKGNPFTLSGLAALLIGKESSSGVAGPRYFKYKGEWLTDIRQRLGN